MTEQTQLKEFPEISKKTFANPAQNAWIHGIISWVILILLAYLTPIRIDIFVISIVVPIIGYRTLKKRLPTYKNPPSIDNVYKYYLHLGFSMGLLSILYIMFLFIVA